MEAPRKWEMARENAIQKLAAALKKIDAAIAEIEQFETHHKQRGVTAKESKKHLMSQARRAKRDLAQLHGWLRKTKADGWTAKHLNPRDKRKLYDERRYAILNRIFDFWEDQGRSLTVTTDPVTGERRGALLDFVNAIVVRVTEPPTPIPAETIVKQLKKYKDLRPEMELIARLVAERQG